MIEVQNKLFTDLSEAHILFTILDSAVTRKMGYNVSPEQINSIKFENIGDLSTFINNGLAFWIRSVTKTLADIDGLYNPLALQKVRQILSASNRTDIESIFNRDSPPTDVPALMLITITDYLRPGTMNNQIKTKARELGTFNTFATRDW